jgi:hypothetical protein
VLAVADNHSRFQVQVTPVQNETHRIDLLRKATIAFGSDDVFKMVSQRVCRQDLLRNGGVFEVTRKRCLLMRNSANASVIPG